LSICTTSLCLNGGTCVESSNSLGYLCQCQAGFAGPICQTNVNECLSCPCYNNGTCYDRVNGYECYCPPGYNGLRCEFETNDCSSSPCVVGQCLTQRPFGYRCLCPQGRTGLRCEIRINECDSRPCKNGGQCTQMNPFGFQCRCPPGYQGMYCEIAINPCDSCPCLNGGSCLSRGLTSWQCHCKCGYTGARCESVVNECANNPCRNGGTCTQPKPCGFVCACPQEPIAFYGTYCENSFTQPTNCIHSAQHTLFFKGDSLGRLRFKDIMDNVFTAYNTENINNRNVCPPAFTLVGNACFKLLGDRLYDWNEAKTQCTLLNSHLTWFQSPQELDLVKAWLSNLVLMNDIWIGGKADNENWNWEMNNTVVPAGLLTQNWAPGKPSNTNNKKATAMLMSRASGLLFSNEHPDKGEYLALCKKGAFIFDNSVTKLTPITQINAVDSDGILFSIIFFSFKYTKLGKVKFRPVRSNRFKIMNLKFHYMQKKMRPRKFLFQCM
jgi:hypothetical protein